LVPQRPWEEQQLPKLDVMQVALAAELLPQKPSVLAGSVVRPDRRLRFAKWRKKLWELVVNMVRGRDDAYRILRSKVEEWAIKIIDRRNTPRKSIFNGVITQYFDNGDPRKAIGAISKERSRIL
jgi:hypothetical protein